MVNSASATPQFLSDDLPQTNATFNGPVRRCLTHRFAHHRRILRGISPHRSAKLNSDPPQPHYARRDLFNHPLQLSTTARLADGLSPKTSTPSWKIHRL